MRVGILSVGLSLAPEIRRNEFWSPDLVSTWTPPPPRPLPAGIPDSARRCLVALAEQNKDPFHGMESRPFLPRSMDLIELEVIAANDALTKAGIDRERVDLLLTNRTPTDVLFSNPAAALHARLGLPRECLSTHLDVATHSFLMQLALAESMVLAGRARCAVLVQSCAPSRLLDPSNRMSPHFGDAATAVVIGPVDESSGILAAVNYTDGRYPKTLIASVPGGAWYDEGRVELHVGDPGQMQQVFLGAADACAESIRAAVARAGRQPDEVKFLAIHQGTTWMREIVRDLAGLTNAVSTETYRATGYLFASMIPASLARAQEAGVLSAGDLVVLVGGGPGQTYGATALVW